MDNCDDPCSTKTTSSGSRFLSERLIKEHTKALEILYRKTDKSIKSNKSAHKPDSFQQDASRYKENAETHQSSSHPTSYRTQKNSHAMSKTVLVENQSKSNLSDYVPYRQREDINISDLITNKSISLNCSRESTLTGRDLSFHPAEMRGRSTLHKSDPEPQRQNQYSVEQILSNSFVSEVRNHGLDSIGLSADSSCISGLSAMQKNPRPTTFSDAVSSAFPSFRADQANFTNIDKEVFGPAKLMKAKMIHDEVSWAQEYATVPKNVLSDEAREKLTPSLVSYNSGNQSLNSTSLSDTNFSYSRFFAKRSADITDIIEKSERLALSREPVVLLNDDTITTSPNKSSYDFEPVTPVIDNKHYSHVVQGETITLTTTKSNLKATETHDSKDSGNATGKSDLLSLSTAGRFMGNDSNSRAIDEILSQTKQLKDPKGTLSLSSHKAVEANPIDTVDLVKQAERISDMANLILENKENIQANSKDSNNASDTLSFTESLLNTSIQNYRISNAGQARSPLSPIPILVTEEDQSDKTAHDDNDADIDDYSHSPVISQSRRRRFTKSPRSPSFSLVRENDKEKRSEELNLEKGSVSISISAGPAISKPSIVVKNTKSLCSTRVERNQNSPSGSNIDISSHFQKVSGAVTPTQLGTNSVFELSPLSSPCSYLSSATNSPNNGTTGNNRVSNRGCRCSPQFDKTATSGVSNGLRRVASSPSPSQIEKIGNKNNRTSTWQCGAPVRMNSNNSIKSSESTSTRSASRCSNNSEFSHRDGIGMPIKATELELSWASIKLRTDSQRSTNVKNISNKRLVVRIEIEGPGFKLVSPDNNKLTLLPDECRTIVVNFSPTMVGPAIGRLVFQPPRNLMNGNNANNTNNEFTIPLYAFGGHASIIIQNLLRGPVGDPFLPMGEFCTLVRPLERSFEIYNKGPLVGFAAIFIEPTRLNVPDISNLIQVHPECTLIEPNMTVTIRIVLQPNHSDLKKIQKVIQNVLTLAKLRIIYGDEPIRQRLRQIQRLKTSATRENVFTRSLSKLWTRFPGEQAMFPPNVFKDTASVAQDMWASTLEQEVALTLNNNMLDETSAELSTIFSEGDNSILFRTICASSPSNQLETVHEISEDTHGLDIIRNIDFENATYEKEMAEADSTSKMPISPECIQLELNNRQQSIKPFILRLRNFSNTRQYFQVSCKLRNLFYFSPTDGYIQPNGVEFPVEVRFKKEEEIKDLPDDINITLFIENKKITVPVHVPSNYRKEQP